MSKDILHNKLNTFNYNNIDYAEDLLYYVDTHMRYNTSDISERIYLLEMKINLQEYINNDRRCQ